MGNSCKCISKVESSSQNRKNFMLQSASTKSGKSKAQRWERVMKLYSTFDNPILAFKEKKPSKFRQYLFEGPPANLRWDVWKAMFSISTRQVILDTSMQEDLYSIEKDLERTFPSHPFFTNTQGQCALRDVLISMVNNHPELGYCQGMNSLAGILLIESKGNILESYAVLESICITLGGKGLFEYGFPLVVQLCEEFHKSLSEKLPAIHRFFENIELDDNLWITKWFMTLFSYSFHLDCVVRIWDAIFAYGLGFMVNIAMGLVSYLKHDLIGKNLCDMLEYLPELKEMYVDIDMVLFHSSKFELRQIDVNPESEGCSETVQDEIDRDDPIQTKWDDSKFTHQHTRSLMEEFSMSSSSNFSKFSV